MKRKVLTLVLITLITNRTFAQDARSAMNQILDGYTLPIFVAFMLAGIVLGLHYTHGSQKIAVQNLQHDLCYSRNVH